MTHFPPGKLRLSCAATAIHAAHILQTSSTLITIHKISRISRTVCEKTDYTCSPLHLKKAEKENNIWGKDKFDLFSYTGLKIHWNFATTIFSRLRDPLIEIFTIKNSWPWKCRSRSWCTTFPVPPFDGKYMTSHLITVVMFFSSFHRLRNIHDARKNAKPLVL